MIVCVCLRECFSSSSRKHRSCREIINDTSDNILAAASRGSERESAQINQQSRSPEGSWWGWRGRICSARSSPQQRKDMRSVSLLLYDRHHHTSACLHSLCGWMWCPCSRWSVWQLWSNFLIPPSTTLLAAVCFFRFHRERLSLPDAADLFRCVHQSFCDFVPLLWLTDLRS